MISLILPTRGRPENIRRFWNSAKETASGEIEACFYIDDDDLVSEEVIKEIGQKYVKGPRIVLSEMWNEAYKLATGDIIGHLGDDIIFRTPDWDTLVRNKIESFPDKIAFVYGKDGYSPDTFGTHGFIHRNWINATGYFLPPYFSSDMNDVWLNDVAKEIGRHFLIPEIYTEHMHFINGKAEKDQTHLDRLERGERDKVWDIYNSKESERHEDARKLKEVMSGT